MNKYDLLDNLVSKGNGYLQASVAAENNISRQVLSKYVMTRGMERIMRGVYITEEVWPDDYYLLYLRNNRIVFSFESSLYLHGLMDREPSKTTVTVPEGYNSSHIQNAHVLHSKKEKYELGTTSIKTSLGNEVPVYDMERTICDIIIKKQKIEIQTFQTAMQEYMRSKEKNLGRLLYYAQQLGIEKEVRTYTEVMLF